jgi:hypothetical protein
MFLINVGISNIYLFFLTRLVRINVKPPLEPLIINSKIRYYEASYHFLCQKNDTDIH